MDILNNISKIHALPAADVLSVLNGDMNQSLVFDQKSMDIDTGTG